MPLAKGSKVGPYEIVAPLGAGGMGEVYRARDTRLGRDVAIKVLPESFSTDKERLQRFQQEARTVATLNHPNVMALFDVGEYNGAPYLVSELLEGETLRDRMRIGALPARRAIEYAAQIAEGLATAHAKGIVHRDLKPENVFITRDNRVKILDFGLAKLVRTEARAAGAEGLTSAGVTQTIPGVIVGTAGYMSPEQVRGSEVDGRTGDRHSRSLELSDAMVVGVSATGDLALLSNVRRARMTNWMQVGTLSRAPATGGVAREILEGVWDADITRDAKDFAVVRAPAGRQQLEYQGYV